MNGYTSECKSLGDKFFKKKFNIPIYQRLYVWENIQVKMLIHDLVSAYFHNKELDSDIEKKDYYLGGIVVVKNGDKYDLIDGQQRFTTLKILRELLGDTDLTLEFIVRDDVWEHFKGESREDSDIARMIDARIELEAGLTEAKIIQKLDETITIRDKNFLRYLKEEVKLVVTTVPQSSDLNKLFELINGRGEQLQQHEILKAKILSRIDKGEQYKYGKIWEICANIDDFLEINIKKSLGETWAEHRFNENFDSLFNKIKENTEQNKDNYSQDEKDNTPTISNIIDNNLGKAMGSNGADGEDEVSTQYLSIISFDVFLLYALVSFKEVNYFNRMDKQIEFKDKNLIQIFERVLLNETNNFDKFIEHLFEIRVKFDNWIIKNNKKLDDKSNETTHKISKVKKSSDGKSWDIEKNVDLSLELLQSMLYHSHTRNTQEWIIPFLKYIDKDEISPLELLKDIDNYLYSQISTDNTILERANEFSIKYKVNIDIQAISKYLEVKPKDNYNHILHYWYYKMDWIIWSLAKDKDNNFKFTARNSIEHISPQNPQNENIAADKVSEDYLNSFGNLFLISGSQNSSVGNEGFKTKISKFFTDKDVKNLKLGLILDYTSWGDDGVKKHFDECLEKFKEYFDNNEKNTKYLSQYKNI